MEEQTLALKVAKVLEKSEQEVLTTPFVTIIQLLVKKIEEIR